ncbi:hypothetical protein QQ045_019687 [Rhodiola kirilowii]
MALDLDITFPETFSTKAKQYLKRRKYQRLPSSDTPRRKLPVLTLGGQDPGHHHHHHWKLKSAARKLKLKSFISPVTLLVKFRDAYIDMMLSWAKKMGMGRTSFSKTKHSQAKAMITVAGQQVDAMLVMEIYSKMVALRNQSSNCSS